MFPNHFPSVQLTPACNLRRPNTAALPCPSPAKPCFFRTSGKPFRGLYKEPSQGPGGATLLPGFDPKGAAG